ncbi:VgrG protein [Minicystis rosea]|nr:VgrG protein [Minicystis rosea]
MIDMFKMSSEGLPEGVRVVGFRGTEGISRLYAFEVFLLIGPDAVADFDLATAVGAVASLMLDRQDGRPPFTFHGILSDVSLVHHQRDGFTLVRALLVPRFWQLTQSLHSRLFTKISIPDIFKQILDKTGQEYALKLSQQYAAEEHVCQYAESDFDFLSRWMEREGMYYFFEQGDAGEKLIITDGKATHQDLEPSPIRFFAHTGGDSSAKECLHTFVCRRRSLPASVSFKDYDYNKPKLDVSAKAPISQTGRGEISVYGARFFSPDDGARLAKLRAEEILSREVVFTGSGTSFYLRAGYTFDLEDHPWPSFAAKYLGIEAEHYGNQAARTPDLKQLTGLDRDEVYRVDVTAIPASVQFRAEAKTAWPRIYGTEHGVIDGPADSEYAQLDEHGRYAVRFAFDEGDLEPGKASTRVRMMQPHGGGVEGWHFPLRKGTEVLFTFLGGDPDRPVIAGVVPNAHKPSPVTSGNHTKNVIQTGGRNRFELEDKEGEQRITFSTPHQNSYIRMGAPNDDHSMIIKTKGPTLLDAGEDWDVEVGANLNERVFGTVEESYFANQITDINSGRKETIHGGGMTHLITGDLFRKVTGDHVLEVTGDFTHKVHGDVNETFGTYDLTCGRVQEKCGDVHLSTGEILADAPKATFVVPVVTINASTSFTVNSPEIKMNTGSAIKSFTPVSAESFGIKTAYGGAKYDHTVIKSEMNGYALGVFGVKGDSVAMSKKTAGAVVDQIGTDIKQVGTAVKNAGARILNAALTKIG